MFFLKRYFTLITRFFKRVSLYGLIKILKYVWFEFYFDNKRGVKTRKIAFLPELSLTSDSHCYMATTEQTFKRIIKDIPKEYFNKNFLDIGCGRGKVLILAKENGFKAKIIGIELSKKLVESCKENIRLLKLSRKLLNNRSYFKASMAWEYHNRLKLDLQYFKNDNKIKPLMGKFFNLTGLFEYIKLVFFYKIINRPKYLYTPPYVYLKAC